MIVTTELARPMICMPERANMMALRHALDGADPTRVEELAGLTSSNLSPEALYAAVGALRFAINTMQNLPAEDALATLIGGTGSCADRVVRKIAPRRIEISEQAYNIHTDHQEDGHGVDTVWIPPAKFNSRLRCDPANEDVALLRDWFGRKKLLLIRINDGRERRKGWLSLESGRFVLLPAGTRLQPSDFS